MSDHEAPDKAHGAVRPRDAATLILIKREGPEPLVLMGQRAAGHVFMPNKVVFPGGRVDPADHRITPTADLKPEVVEALARKCNGVSAKALALAAIRETFEETGLLVGAPHGGKSPTRSKVWDSFYREGVAPRLDILDLIARAITPPYRPRRFDARFFMADASHIQGDLHNTGRASGELLDLHWIPLDKARQLDLPSITRRVLDEIELRLTKPETAHPIPFFRVRHGKHAFEDL
jgi:8-oxo-dGTP pyrophosphatase MutT (NUDIX family)